MDMQQVKTPGVWRSRATDGGAGRGKEAPGQRFPRIERHGFRDPGRDGMTWHELPSSL